MRLYGRRSIDVKQRGLAMSATGVPRYQDCNCFAARRAARHITQFYDRFLAPSGLRTTQFSILVKLRRRGTLTINALAADMVLDRTTLGRNIVPLARDGLIVVETDKCDRRSKTLRLTARGAARYRAAAKGWAQAQAQFEIAFGADRTAAMRALLHDVAASDLGGPSPHTRIGEPTASGGP
jgi:DNA-binding MarR family transcriptional regulator